MVCRMPSCRPGYPFPLMRSGRWAARSARRAASSIADVIARVGRTMDRLAETRAGEDVVIAGHGGAIRAAVAHALRIGADNALHLAIQNLSLTRLERSAKGWRVLCVNEMPGY